MALLIFSFAEKKTKMQDITFLLSELTTNIYRAQQMTPGISGFETGFAGFDTLTSGLQKSELILLSGPSGIGLTPFALSIIRNKIKQDPSVGIVYFSTLLSEMQILTMLVCGEIDIDISTLKSGQFNSEKQKLLDSFIEKCKKSNIYIDDTPNQSFDEILSKIEDIRDSYRIDCIIIDSLEEFCNDKISIEDGLKALKDIAKITCLPVIVLLETNVLKVMNASLDLMDISPQVKRYKQVDMHCLLHRHEYYQITEDESGQSVLGDAELFILQNEGNTGSVKFKFEYSFYRFREKSQEQTL